MRIPDRGLGARAVLVAALAMAALAGPATAGEVAYLMYIKGSEGPPATPMRVLWDARDDANARITVDLGAKYEPTLTKLGLERVLAYDARREQSQFVVRDPEFTRFVKTVAGLLVQGLLTASAAPGAWAQPPDAQVEGAALLIKPAPARLEVTASLHVTYLAPQKLGRPKVQDLIKGDIAFVGQPEPAGADATAPNKP